MNGFFTKVGFIIIILTIFYIIKKINEYYYYKKINFHDENTAYESESKVYKAARAFAQGINADEVRSILINCIDFDEEDIEEILSLSLPHRIEDDGGYRAFIKAVNKVLGQDFYHVTVTK